jgi:hypothetical protein
VEAILKSGERIVTGTFDAVGDPERPLDDEAVRAKFMDLAGPVLGVPRAQALHAEVEYLWQAADSRALVAAAAAP